MIMAMFYDITIQIAVVFGVLGTGLAGLAAILKYTRLGRLGGYIWFHLVSAPLGKWFGEAIDARLNYRNDGKSFRDQIDGITTSVSELSGQHKVIADRVGSLEEGQGAICNVIKDLQTSVSEGATFDTSLDERVEELEEAVTESG